MIAQQDLGHERMVLSHCGESIPAIGSRMLNSTSGLEPEKKIPHNAWRIVAKTGLCTAIGDDDVLSLFTTVAVRRGEVIARSGTKPRGVCVIASGECVALDDWRAFDAPNLCQLGESSNEIEAKAREIIACLVSSFGQETTTASSGSKAPSSVERNLTSAGASTVQGTPTFCATSQRPSFLPMATLRCGVCVNALAAAAGSLSLETVIASTPVVTVLHLALDQFRARFVRSRLKSLALQALEAEGTALHRRRARSVAARNSIARIGHYADGTGNDASPHTLPLNLQRAMRCASHWVGAEVVSGDGTRGRVRAVASMPPTISGAWLEVEFEAHDLKAKQAGHGDEFCTVDPGVIRPFTSRLRSRREDALQTAVLDDFHSLTQAPPGDKRRVSCRVLRAPVDKVRIWADAAKSASGESDNKMNHCQLIPALRPGTAPAKRVRWFKSTALTSMPLCYAKNRPATAGSRLMVRVTHTSEHQTTPNTTFRALWLNVPARSLSSYRRDALRRDRHARLQKAKRDEPCCESIAVRCVTTPTTLTHSPRTSHNA